MNIKPLNLTNIKPLNIQNNQRKILSTPAYDMFVRSTPAFKGDEENSSFAKWADKTNFLKESFPNIITNRDNILGSGYSHSTYVIPGNDEYILRGPNYKSVERNLNQFDFSTAKFNETEDKNLKINIGQSVGNVIVETDSGIPMAFQVLKKQEGTSYGIPHYTAISDEITGEVREGELPYEAPERKEKYAKSLETAANMPLEAYSQLISDLEEASKAGYQFDHLNSNNFLLDTKNNRFNLIDMDKKNGEVNYGNILYALTNINYFPTYTSKSPFGEVSGKEIEKAIDNTIQIIDKFTTAMKENDVKFDKDNTTFEFNEFLRSYPMSYIVRSYDTDKKWEYFEQKGIA